MAHFTAALYTKLERFEDRSDGAPPAPNGKKRNQGNAPRFDVQSHLYRIRVIRLSLRGAQRRGNLVEVEHVPGNHHCYGDEIATLRSQ